MIFMGERSETTLSIRNVASEASYVSSISEISRQNCNLTYANLTYPNVIHIFREFHDFYGWAKRDPPIDS